MGWGRVGADKVSASLFKIIVDPLTTQIGTVQVHLNVDFFK